MSKTQLHEVLAAEKKVVNKVAAIKASVMSNFKDKTTYFDGQTRTYNPANDEGRTFPAENQRLRSSVTEDLGFFNKALTDIINLKLSKAIANTKAVSDLHFRGNVIAKDVPATGLLDLEKDLIDLRNVLKVVPTRDANETWSYDESENYYKGKPSVRDRTEKSTKHKVVVQPTEAHPAQVVSYTVEDKVGEWTTVLTSTRISTVEKSALLNNVDEMIIEVKKARTRANKVEVEHNKLGNDVVTAIFKDVIQHPTVVEGEELKRLQLV